MENVWLIFRATYQQNSVRTLVRVSRINFAIGLKVFKSHLLSTGRLGKTYECFGNVFIMPHLNA